MTYNKIGKNLNVGIYFSLHVAGGEAIIFSGCSIVLTDLLYIFNVRNPLPVLLPAPARHTIHQWA